MTGKELREILLNAGYVLSDIADKMKISPQTLNSRLNAKTIKIEFVKELCSVIEKPLSFFSKENEGNDNLQNGVVPYEFVQAMIEERKRHDEMNAELIRQNGELIEIIKENKKTTVQPGVQKDATCATVSASGSEK